MVKKTPEKREPPLKINTSFENVINIGLKYNHKAKRAKKEKKTETPEEGG